MFKLGLPLMVLVLVGCGSPEPSTIEVEEVTTPVLLRIGDQKGDKWSLAMNSSVEAGGNGSLKLNLTVSTACIGRSADRVRYRMSFPAVSASSGDGQFASMVEGLKAIEGVEIEVVSDLRNNILATYYEGQEVPNDDTSDSSRIVLPEKPVKSGDTWEGELVSGEIRGKLIYTFRGKIVHNGVEAYVVAGEFASGQPVQNDPGFEYIFDAKRMQVLQMKGGFKEGSGVTGEFHLVGSPN